MGFILSKREFLPLPPGLTLAISKPEKVDPRNYAEVDNQRDNLQEL